MLLGIKPEGAEHDSANCPFCTSKQVASSQEEEVSEKLYNQEQLDALVASSVEKATTELRASVDAETLALNERLENAEKALAERDAKIADLEAVIAEREEQDRLNTLADERARLVKAAVNFDDEQIASRKLFWAKMPDEAFASYLEDMKAVRSSASDKKDDIPESEFDGTREVAAENEQERDVVREFFAHGLEAAKIGG